MSFSQGDIDNLMRQFRDNPSADTYGFIDNWYENNVSSFPNNEYMICVYLFLVGANIRHRYKHLTYDQHLSLIKEIRDIIQDADPLYRNQRKAYFDLGNKSGFYR